MSRESILACTLLILASAASAQAHVGSPDVYFEGDAGPYRLFVTIRVPQVVPGIAEIEIRSQSNDVQEVRIVPLRLTGPGSELPPTPDTAQRSPADPQFFTGSLWLMEFGSLQVRIEVDGARGKGVLGVPVLSEAQRTLPMQKSLGALLFALMIFLSIGVVSIVGASVREAKLEPGLAPTPENRRRARIAMAVAAAVVVGILYLGNRWWKGEAQGYASNIYANPRAEAKLEPGGRLVLCPTDQGWIENVKKRPLIPDHDHLMHLFLIRLPGLDRLLHLHPEQTEPGVFTAALPSLPSGRYQVFADVVHQSGFPETILAEIELPHIEGKALAGDDSEGSAPPLSQAAKASTTFRFLDGGRMVWLRDSNPLRAGVATLFRFRVDDTDGMPAHNLEPYMGMPGHAEFVRSDLKVFAHVHPSGSVSMAALQLAEASLIPGGAAAHPGMAMPAGPLPPEVSFPYGFPQSGDYRLFVQVKRAGKVETGVFDARVE